MDGFTYQVHSSIWEDSSDKQYGEVELESPVFITPPAHLISNGDDVIGLGADSAYLPVTGGCELTNLPLDAITSSDPAIWASYQNLNDLGVQNQTNLNGSGLLAQQKYLNGMNGLNLNSFASGSQMVFSTTGFPQALDIPHQDKSLANANQLLAQLNGVAGISIGTGGGFDGPFKPRIRARRGQATDPHSIAERLRREKISERMKSLQELVPNSNRTDKASMLDEIIDYVKFLQLQVKVLSMSRLGATEAVVPLLTESQPEGSSSSISSVSIKPTQLDTCRASEALQDSTTFEQEVIKLMDSNVTSAMQYLQNKGLCLMPIALASAINTQKGTHTASIPSTNRNSNSSLCGDRGFQ